MSLRDDINQGEARCLLCYEQNWTKCKICSKLEVIKQTHDVTENVSGPRAYKVGLESLVFFFTESKFYI